MQVIKFIGGIAGIPVLAMGTLFFWVLASMGGLSHTMVLPDLSLKNGWHVWGELAEYLDDALKECRKI